jgi:hypothetical protein
MSVREQPPFSLMLAVGVLALIEFRLLVRADSQSA